MKIIEQIGDQPPKERLTFAAKKMIGNPEALLEEFPLAKVEQMLPKGTCNAYLKESASSSLTPVEHQHLLSPSISVVGKGTSSVNNTGLPNYSLSTTVPYLLPTNASLNHISSNRNVATPNSQSHQIDKNDHVENYISFPVPSRDSFTEKESNSREQLPNVVHQQKLQTINESTSKD